MVDCYRRQCDDISSFCHLHLKTGVKERIGLGESLIQKKHKRTRVCQRMHPCLLPHITSCSHLPPTAAPPSFRHAPRHSDTPTHTRIHLNKTYSNYRFYPQMFFK